MKYKVVKGKEKSVSTSLYYIGRDHQTKFHRVRRRENEKKKR